MRRKHKITPFRYCDICNEGRALYKRDIFHLCGNCMINYAVRDGKVIENITYSMKGETSDTNADNILKKLVSCGYANEI